MYFLELAEIFEKMEQTTSRLELTNHLVYILKKTTSVIIDKIVYLIQGKLGPDYQSKQLGVADKVVIKSLALASGYSVNEVQIKYNEIGDIGDVAYEILKSKLQTTLFYEKLTIERLYNTLLRISELTGSGSIELKLKYINSLLNNSTNLESKFILKLILGNLRLGIADFTVLDAIAIAFTGDKKNRKILERAYNVSSDLGKIARILFDGSIDEVKSIPISIFVPVRPMLAERASDAEEALKKMNGKMCYAEYKIDGERIQIHKHNNRIELYTRNLENVTNNFSDLVHEIEKINSKDLIAEGEIVSVDLITGRFLPFQSLMHRRRKYNIEDAIKDYPVLLNLFDILYYDNQDKTNLPFSTRRKILEEVLSFKHDKIKLINQKTVAKVEEIDKFMTKAIENGCEGLMIKNPNSTYRAGAREWAWIKLKKEYSNKLLDTIDLVIVGAIFGKGRRVGKYGALLLASYEPDEDTFYTICKVGTGFTDEILDEISKKLKNHIIENKNPRVISGEIKMDVWFEPKIVIETFSPEITLSPIYTTSIDKIKKGYGLALRFPKFTGKIREDKNAEDSTTIKEIENIYKKQLKSI
ncbi:MAG: ATP-dependent DNA ligase [Nitrosopumilus sp.]|nr:ATP-dependent DNA ligase [Nitrosopumilus sp.]